MLLYLPAESPPLKPSGPSRHLRRSTFSWCLGDEFSSPRFYFEPAILTEIRKGDPAYEFFGPVFLIFKVQNETEALALANDTVRTRQRHLQRKFAKSPKPQTGLGKESAESGKRGKPLFPYLWIGERSSQTQFQPLRRI